MTHKEKAESLLHQQYHCSQALFGAFAEEFDLDLKTAFRISTCFGGGMRCGKTCGCISASLLVLGMAAGFYDSEDRELELYGNRKTEEFMRLFEERMGGKLYCREILGKDITIPEEMAVIRQEGLMPEICPKVMGVSIDILEELLAEELKGKEECEIESIEELSEADEIRAILKQKTVLRRFRKNVQRLLHSTKKPVAFLQFDIRRFKIINDSYGERFGDEILAFILEELQELCRDDQYFANLHSDVFVIVTEYTKKEELQGFIAMLDLKLKSFKNVPLQMTYGVYTVEDPGLDLWQMEDRAAMARKSAKNNILSNVVFYREQFKDSLYNRKFIEENVEAAIQERQFKMYLQPKYSIEQNEIIGAEALVRWRHPERGMIFPDQFIPVIEENGFVKRLDYFIWTGACQFIQRCEKAGVTPCPISVNVSRIHLRDDECIRILSGLIREYGISKEFLELEITESADNQQISRKAFQLKDEGYTLLMDDFGSGYSSLNVLLETPFDVIKLDKKFVDNMIASDKGRLILEQVVLMANRLGLGILAEGVETQNQVDLLRQIGCDQVQGYYYAKPMPEDDFFELLSKQSAARRLHACS